MSGCAPRPRSPPTALERRLEQLATVPPQPITVYSKESEKMTRLKRGLSQEDKGIAERLQRLQRYLMAMQFIFIDLFINLPKKGSIDNQRFFTFVLVTARRWKISQATVRWQ